jgi:predicted acyl esterase
MSDGVEIDLDIFRPQSGEKFPVILGAHPYSKEGQMEPIKANSTSAMVPHPGEERTRGSLEAGDPYFFARRGYVHAIANVRGSGKSGGKFVLLGPREIDDVCELIEWLSQQDWSNGNVGMFGVSYFAMLQFLVASRNPPHLKCIFSPWGTTDMYREMFYHGGILASRWTAGWPGTSMVYANVKPESQARKDLGEEKFKQAIEELMQDEDIKFVPELAEALRNPDKGFGPFITDILIHRYDSRYWEERRPKVENIKIPVYFGADWGIYRNHLPAAFRCWEKISSPKLMIIGPPIYLDRPVYQLQYESLRWFDYWLKGIETRILEEPPIRLFVLGTGKWKKANEWPLPETKWTPFYLHEGNVLSERDYFPFEGSDSYFDSPWSRGFVEFFTPRLVEDTEIIGPIVLNLFGSTTDSEVLWSVRIFQVDSEDKRKILTGGWLRGTHREVDHDRSKPWHPYHSHARSEELVPGEIYDFQIPIVPTANLFASGTRIGLRISSVDYDIETSIGGIAAGHIKRQRPSRITVFHDEDHPSHLLLPVTNGNVLGTYLSGGKPYL